MSEVKGSIRLAVVGWLTIPIVGILVIATRGAEEIGVSGVTRIIAIVMAVWLWKRASRASLITSLVLGSLLGLQHLGYAPASLSDTQFEATTVAIDAVALVGSTLIIIGTIGGLLDRRRARAGATVGA